MADVTEYEYRVPAGKSPTYLLVTDAEPEDVEATLHVGKNTYDLAEFKHGEADPRGRWGHRVGARVPLPLPEGDHRIEWNVDGTHVATYTLHVTPAAAHQPTLKVTGD